VCGFFASNHPSIDDRKLPIIERRVGFRGPDFQSQLVRYKGWALYHARLSIIAPDERFSQPYRTPSGGMLLFNGEILNYRELADHHGIDAQCSDTHLLSILLERQGFDLNELDGFFAFILIDNNGKLVHCARDRFGVKPLFVQIADGFISISSEASALSDCFDLPFNERALEEYAVFRAPVFEPSYFDRVETVAPGSCLIHGSYFDTLEYADMPRRPLEDVLPELRRAICDAIESRLIADVPVGLLYSGGIDSNLVKTLAGREFQCFTAGLDGEHDVEFARKTDTNIHLTQISTGDFQRRLRDMVALRKEPLSVPNEVLLSFLAEEWARRGGKVLLSGEAADEFFAGYDRIFLWAYEAEAFDVNGFLERYAYVEFPEIPEWIVEKTKDFFDALGDLDPFAKVRQWFLKIHLPILFRRLDFGLMYAGIEGREPLARLDIFKLAMQIDPADFFARGVGKYPLRLIAAAELGDGFAFATKVGFPIDLKQMYCGETSRDRADNYRIWRAANLKELA
jgi:asparagine synthase (glutamine-hydrolysing)